MRDRNQHNWSGSMHVWALPLLDLPYTMAGACLTNSYWKGEEETMSINMLRKGAIAYYGAVSITFGSPTGLTHFYDIIKELTDTDANSVTLGKVHSSNTDKSKLDYVLLADPTLQLKLKQVSW